MLYVFPVNFSRINHVTRAWYQMGPLRAWMNNHLTAFHWMLTHWGRDRMATIFQTTLSNAFSCMKILELWLKFHWSLSLRVQLTIVHHWFRWWLGAHQATSYYLNQWWLDYWHIYALLGLNEFIPLGIFTAWSILTQYCIQYDTTFVKVDLVVAEPKSWLLTNTNR